MKTTLVALALLAPSMIVAADNIVLIVADDLGCGDVGCYGATDVRTPAIDRLATEGTRWTTFYANAPECTPTRTALLTGRYQHRVGGLECAIGTGNVGRYDDAIRLAEAHDLGLPPKLGFLPRALKEKGYRTAAIGKWHLGYEPKFRPLRHGFDRAFGPLGGGCDYFHHTEPVGAFLGDQLAGDSVLACDDKPCEREGYLTHLVTDEAVRWIAGQNSERPFFLYVPYTAPHTPLQGPGDYRPEKLTAEEWNRGTREKYVELVEELDKGVGRILDALDRRDLSKRTAVIFFSDNGPTKKGRTGGFRGNKGQLFEGGIRVPCVVRLPGRLRPGSIAEHVSIAMDLTASIARISGVPRPKSRPFDGVDMIARAERGAPVEPRTLFWRARRGERTERAVRAGSLKYLHRQLRPGRVEEYLFNLARDPAERENLLASRPADVARLRGLLERWEIEVKPVR